MKQIKIILIVLSGVFLMSVNAAGQANASLNILTQHSGRVNVGSTINIQVTVAATTGLGGEAGPIPVNKVRVQISVPAAIASPLPNGQQTGIPSGWTILSNSGGVITVCNGSDIIPVGQQRQILIKVQGTGVGGPSTVAGSLSFGPGGGVCTGPGSLTGDNTGDNTSTSSIQGLPQVACTLSSVTAVGGTIACNGGTTTITATPVGAAGPVEYSITGGDPFHSGNIFTVVAGTYTVTAREADQTNCTATASPITINQPA